jgi:hypothetical protein
MLVQGGALRMEPDSSRNWQNSEWMGGTTCKVSQTGSDPEPELFQEGWHRPKTSRFQPGIFSLWMDKLINGIWKIRKRINVAKSRRLQLAGGAVELSSLVVDHGWIRQVNAQLELENIVRKFGLKLVPSCTGIMHIAFGSTVTRSTRSSKPW